MKVNKISLKQVGGEQQNQPVDPAMQQMTEFISNSINEGQDPVDIVVGLVGQEIDTQIIAEAFMTVGYKEEDIISLFEAVKNKSQPSEPASNEEQTQNPQEIARNKALELEAKAAEEQEAQQAQAAKKEALTKQQDEMSQTLTAKSGIEINPKNKGKFTRWARSRGMSVAEAYAKVMSNTKGYSKSVVKMANFAKNAAGWKKEEGGEFTPHLMYKGSNTQKADTYQEHLKLKEFGYIPKAQIGLESPPFTVESTTTNNTSQTTAGGKTVLDNVFDSVDKVTDEDGLSVNHISSQTGGPRKLFGIETGGIKPDVINNSFQFFNPEGELQFNQTTKSRGWPFRNKLKTKLNITDSGIASGYGINTAQTGIETNAVNKPDVFTNSPAYLSSIATNNKDFNIGTAAQTLGTEFNNLFGNNLDSDGNMEGVFRDKKRKRAQQVEGRGDYYNYDLTIDPNDPNTYAGDNLDLYNAATYNSGLRTQEQFANDVNENSRVNYNTETGKYDSLISSRKLNDDIYGEKKGLFGNVIREGNNALSGENLNYFNNYKDDEVRDLIIGTQDDPEGTTLGINEQGQASSYAPGADNPYQYDTMMGYNSLADDSQPPTPQQNVQDKLNELSMIPTGSNGQPEPAMYRDYQDNPIDRIMDFNQNPYNPDTDADGIPNTVDRMGSAPMAGGPTSAQSGPRTQETGATQRPSFRSWYAQNSSNFQGKSQSEIQQIYNSIGDDEFRYGGSLRQAGALPKAQGGNSDWEAMFPDLYEVGNNNQNIQAPINQATGEPWEQPQQSIDAYPVNNVQEETDEFGRTFAQRMREEGEAYTFGQLQSNGIDQMGDLEGIQDIELEDDIVEDDIVEDNVNYKAPKVKKTNTFEGGFNRMMDSNQMNQYAVGSTAAVNIAKDVINPFFDNKKTNEAIVNNRSKLVADVAYGTKEDPAGKRGNFTTDGIFRPNDHVAPTGTAQGGTEITPAVISQSFMDKMAEEQKAKIMREQELRIQDAIARENYDDLGAAQQALMDMKSGMSTTYDLYNQAYDAAEEYGVEKLLRNLDPVVQTSNFIDDISIPSNLVAEFLEWKGGLGDGEFNFYDAMPAHDGNFNNANYNGTPQKNPADVLGVDGFWSQLATNILLDPTSYLGAGLFRNLTQKLGKNAPKWAFEFADDIVRQSDDAVKTIGTKKQGGETANVDSTMLAKLIAAGADIKIL